MTSDEITDSELKEKRIAGRADLAIMFECRVRNCGRQPV